MGERSVAIYPGSFDPVTNGHLDIIERGAGIFDKVVVALLLNVAKEPFFTLEERLDMLRTSIVPWPNVEVDTFDGLLVTYATARKARVILRGIRAVSDFEYEFQMALMNRRLAPTVETVFMVPAEPYSYLSSSLVKEVSRLGGPVSGLVPPIVERYLHERIQRKETGRSV
jgi:pantetheine-phosphate adenylyltransferase